MGTNQEAVRRHNLGAMLALVHRAGCTSRAELTSEMALNRSTIAGLATELEALGAVRRSDPVATTAGAGRPSAGLEVAAPGPEVLAVDVRVDEVVVGRVGLGGRVLDRRRAPLPPDPDPNHVADLVAALTADVRCEPGGPTVGLGIGIPGVIRSGDSRVIFAPNLGWHDVDFASIVAARIAETHPELDLPCAIGNDADVAAWAEHLRGVGRGVDHLVYLSGHVGVGAGVIADGRPLSGAAGFAGEAGHMPYTPDGLPCHCGRRGCWETEIGAEAIARAIGAPSESVAGLGAVLADYAGDPAALDGIAAHLGRGLGSVVNLLNPQLVILGGYLGVLFSMVERPVLRALQDASMSAPAAMARVRTPGLGADSVLIGAAELAFAPLLHDPVAVLT